MPRKGCVAKRDVLPDPIYNSKLVTRLINKIMLDGKKGTAQRILYTAFKIVEEKTNKDAMAFGVLKSSSILPKNSSLATFKASKSDSTSLTSTSSAV